MILADSVGHFGVHRYRCSTCRGEVSFLPDFCAPYKHYGVDIIYRVLSLLLLLGRGLASVADPGKDNEAGYSSWCVREWPAQFKRNSNNLWQFGLPRLLGAAVPTGGDCSELLRRLVAAADGKISHPDHALRLCQTGLCVELPGYGLFRAMLMPGCVT